jgi:putative transposase
MKRRRHTPEQIIRKLRGRPAAGRGLGPAGGGQAARSLGGHLPPLAGPVRRPESRRRQTPQELEAENARLKRIVTNKELQIEALKELGRGNW